MRRFSKLTFSLCFTVVSLFFNPYLSIASIKEAKTEPCLITAEEFNENPLISPAINFVGGSLFVGSGRNSVWIRAAINEPGNVYVAIYATDPGLMTGAQIRTAAITAGVQNSPVNGAVEVAGTTPVGTFSQQQQFTAASVPSFPSFTGTPYAGTRYTGLTFGTTYFYRIVARDAAGTNFSPIISGTITTAADLCGASSPGSNQFGSDAKLCGPRNVQFNMSLTGISYGDPYLLAFRYFFLFEVSGTGGAASNGTPALTNPTQLDVAQQVWSASQTYLYPDNGTICAYNARAYLYYSDQGLCPVFQDQTFEVFDDIANTALGQIGISPPLPTGIEVCEGSDAMVNFTNTSRINCVAPIEVEKKNTQIRWYQYVYGINNAAADFMDKVEIIVPAGTPNYPPGANPGFPGGSVITTFPYFGPIRVLPPSNDETTPLPPSFQIHVLNTNVFGPDNIHRVQLRMWNICNPYDDTPGPEFPVTNLSPTNGNTANGDVAPITTFSDVILVQKPPIPTAVPKNICRTSALPTFEINYAGASTSVRWYDDNAGVMGALVATTGANTKTLSAGTAGITPVPNSGTVGVYAVWAQYQRPTTGTVQCFSDPVRTTITVKESPLPTPAAFTTSTTQVCQGDINVTFQLPATSPSQTVGGATQYEWVATDNADVAVPGTDVLITPQADGRTALVNFPSPGAYTTRIRKIRVRSVYSAGVTCPSNYRDVTVTIFGPSQAGTIAPASQTICEGGAVTNITWTPGRGTIQGWEKAINAGGFVADGTLGVANPLVNPPVPLVAGVQTTYRYRAVIQNGTCSPIFSPVATVIVNPIPPKPTISTSGPTTFCFGGNVTLTSSNVGGLAASYRWYRNGVFTGTTTSNIVLSTVAQSGNYTVEVIGVAPSNCASPLSDPTTVTINPLPTAPNPTGGGAVCAGNPAPDIVWTGLTGTAPFSITYTINAVPTGPIVENTTTFTISNPIVAGIYQITALTDANGCPATVLGGTTSVTIGGAAPVLDRLPNLIPAIACDNGGSTTDPQLDLSLDPASTVAGTFILTYRINGGGNLIKNFSLNLGNGDPSPAISFSEPALDAVAVHTITVVSIQSPAGCLLAVNTPLSFTVRALPSITTQPVNEAICALGNTTFTTAATGTNLSFQWEEKVGAGAFTALANGGVYSGVTTSTLTLTGAPLAMNSNQYRVIVTGYNPPSLPPLCPVTSGVATLTVNAYATITTQPADAAQCVGLNRSFSITAAGPGIAYRWQQDPDGPGALPFSDLADGIVGGVTYSGTGTATVTLSNVTLALNASQYRVRLTTTGACSLNSNAATFTVNPLPVVTNLTPQLCEDVSGGGTHANFDLTTLDADVTGGVAGVTVEWFADPGPSTPIVPATTPQNITNGAGGTYFVRLTSAAGCQNTGTVTFTVNTLPAAVDRSFEFCENTVGAGLAGNFAGNMIDLTSFEFGAGGVTNGGTAVTRDVEWYEDAALTTLIPSGAGVGAEQNYTITATTTIFAKVIDITSPVTPTQCFDVADVTLTLKLRPIDNPITGSATVCTGSTIVLYQVNPALNPGSNYTWNVSGTADFQIFGGGGTNSPNFFVLLRFPGPTIGNVDISVFETLNGCDGNTSNFTVTVAGAPGALTFNSPQTNVCKSQTGVVYSLNAPNPLSLYTWTAPGASFQGPSSGVGLSSVTLDFTTITPVTVSVTETSSSGCAGSPASVVVNLVDRPVITSSSATSVCSGNAPTLVFTATLGGLPSAFVNFGWQVINVTGAVSGTTVGNTGTGNLSEVLTNTSGVIGLVTYRVTPTETAVPNPPNCAGIPQDVVVTVNPQPVLITPQTKTICSGEAANYEILLTPSTLPTGTTFSWPLPALSSGPAQGTAGANVPGGGAGSIHITDVLVNTTANPITATYTITPISGSACPGTPQTVVITINPEPTIATTLDNTVCSDVATGLTLSTIGGSVAAATFNVSARTIAGGLTAAGGNAFVPATGVSSNYLTNDRFTNLTANPLDVTYTVAGVSALGCIGSPRVITITIDPEPIVANGLNSSVCSDQLIGLTLNTTGTSVAAASYNITSQTIAAGLVAAGTNAVVPANAVAANYLINDTYTNIGLIPLDVTYTIVPVSVAGCLGDARIITMTINPEPVISSGLSKSVCSSSPIALTFATTAGSVAASSYNVTARTVDPGLTIGGSNVVVPATGVGANYLTADVYTNTTGSALPVTYTVEPLSAGGCLGSPVVITITINPEPVMSATLNNTVCSDLATGLVLNTNGTSAGAASYNISARTISAGLTPNGGNVGVPAAGVAANFLANDIFTNTGASALAVTYTVVPVSSAGCLGAPIVITLTINPEPVVSTSLDATVCSSQAIGLTLNTNGTSVAAAAYNITGRTIAAGLTASGGNVVVPAAGVADNYLINDIYTNTGVAPLSVTYTVIPVSAAGCLGNARVITRTIDPEPVVASTLDATLCSDASIALTFNTNGTSVAAANYNVTSVIPAAGLIANPANVVIPALGVAANYVTNDKYTNPTAAPLTVGYTIQAVSSVGCLSVPRLITMTINPEPVLANTLDATICSDLTIGLTLATNGTSVAAANYNIVSRTVTAGLTSAGTNVVVPATGVSANYLVGDIFTNLGAIPRTVTYVVVPVSTAGCIGDPRSIIITVEPEPVVANGLDVTVCSDLSTGINLNTNGTSVSAANYNITSRTISVGLTPDGSNAIVPAAGVVSNYLATDKFTNLGASALTVTYTVVPVSAAGCLGNPRIITATIDPEPVISTSLNATICSDVASTLLLNTNGLSVAAASYNVTARSIDPGLTAGGTNAIVPAAAVANNYLSNDLFTNTGALPLSVTYTVEPVSAIGCIGDPVVITLTISPEPVLSGTLNLTQCSDIPTSLVLNTNGTSVAAQNYNITAIAISAGLTAAGTNAVVPATGVNANYLGNDVFTNIGASPLTVTYTIVPVSAANCQGNPANVVVTINPEPVVSNTLNATVCSDANIALTLNTNGTSVSAANYNVIASSIAGGLTAGAGNAIIPANNVAANYLVNDVYSNTGSLPLTVTYTVIPTSTAGCAGDAKIITMTINPEPVVSTALDATICSDAAIGLTLSTDGTSVGAATYNITSQSIDPSLTPAGANVAVPAVGVAANYLATNRYTNTGTIPLPVTYTVVPRSAAGCFGQPQVITMTINPEPVIADGLDVIVCSDLANGLVLSTAATSVVANDYNIVGVTIPAGLTAAGTNAVVPATGVAFNYLAADSYTNITPSALNVTYLVVPRSAALCLGNPKIITVTIQPEPVVASNLDATKCSDAATGLMLSTAGSSVAAANYNVTAINVAGGLVASASNAVVANGVAANYLALDVFTNTSSSPLDVQYTVVPLSAIGCAGNPRIITITINPEPVISTTLDASVCSDMATGLTLNTNGVSVVAASFNVLTRTVAAGLTPAVTNAIVPANAVAANYLLNDKFTNTGSAPLTVVYSVNGVSGTACVGDLQNITITIDPEPVLGSGLNRTVCSDIAGGIIFNTNGTSVAAANYNVTAVSIAVGLTTISAVAIPATGVAANYLASDIYTNSGNVPLDVTYTVVPVSGAGCLGDPLLIRQTINPEPVLAVLDKTVCSDISIGVTLSSNGVSVAATTFDVTNIVVAGGLTPAGTNSAVPASGVASNYIFNDQFTNPGNTQLTVQYTIIPNSAGSCAGDPVIVVVIVEPEPVLSATLDRTVCSDTPGGVVLNTNGVSVAAANYNLTNIVVSGGLVARAGNAIIANGVGTNYLTNDQFTNTTNSSLTVSYSVVPVSASGCLGNPLDVILTIDPEPVVDPALATKSICSREISNITLDTNGSSVAAASYNISLVSQDAGLTGTPTIGPGLAANAIINDNFINVTSTPLMVVYQIVPISAIGCLGDPFIITITVNAEPVVNPALDNVVCSDEVSGIILSTNGTSIAAGTYRLVSVVIPGTITANGANVAVGLTGGINLIRNDRYSNTTNANAIVTYEIRGISSLGCEGASEFIDLTVNPAPNMVPGTANLCSDVPSGIIVGPAAGSATITEFELKNIVKAPALVAGGSNAGLGTYPANLAGGQSDFLLNDTFTNTTNGPLVVTYTIVPIAGGCRGVDQTVVFTVNPAPAVDDNLNKTVCSDETAGIVFATETSPPSTAAASYNITVIAVQAGLIRTAGNAVFPRNGVTANDIQADQFQNPTNDPLTVTYSVQAVSGSTCLGPVRNIILTVEPQVIAAPVNNAPSICSNDQTDIDLISPTNPTSGVITFNYTAVSSVGGQISGFVPSLNSLPENYKITDALVNNSDNPATVTYTITANANGARNGAGCSSIAPVATVVVTVDPKPKLVASPSIQTVCEGVATNVTLNSNTVPSGGGNVQFELLSAIATGGVTGMTAVGTLFTPGSSLADVLSNPTITAQTVTYTLQPRIIGGLGCIGDNVVVTITVNPLPTIVASPQPDICSGDFINITLTPDVANTVATWTVSAPAAVAGASNGAGNLIFQTLFNNGNIPETVTYTVTPKVNGCNGTPIVIQVVVNPKPKFVGLPPGVTVCHGATLNVPLNSTVAGTTFDWVVDDPSGLGVPTTGSGNVINQPMTNTTGSQASLTYTITPTGPGSCPGDQKILIVAVSPQISAQFLNTSSSICKGSSEFLIIEVQGQAPFQIVYNDGTSDITLNNAGNVKVVQVTPTVSTTYTIISIRDALNCSFLPAGQTVTVTVGETDANFSIVGPASSCGPYNATFQFNQVAGTEYTWQWFDGSPDEIFLATTTIPNNTISHVFTNPNPNAAIAYKVTLRTQLPAPFPGCFKSTTQNVTIFPSIITNAFPDRSIICSGENIQFFNQSFGATSHRWFYRVQGTATEIDIRTTPTVNYNFVNTSTTNPIIYEVVYQANNGNCPAPDVVMPITVYRAITAGFDEGTIPPFIGGNSTVNFTNTSVPIDGVQFRYEWNFGLNATPLTATGVGPFAVNYSTPGPRDISLKVVNIDAETAGLGCESTFSKTINIPLLPLVAAFVADPQRACFPSDFTVTENTSTGDVMDWRVIDSNGRVAATSNAALPVFRITNPGSYSIFLTTSNSLTGQVANTQQSGFEVFDNPFASFDLRPTVVYVPDTELTTFNFSTGATDYEWDFGDGGTSVDLEPTYVYKVEGVYEVRLIARNDHGQGLVCTDTLVRTVTAKQGGVTKVPNAFTPNPNGPSGGQPGTGGSGTFNDIFLPIVKGAEEFNMQIFDRWGNLIFESNSANVGWDGYDKDGRLLPAGVFVYKLTIRLSDGQRSTQIGDVTMIR